MKKIKALIVGLLSVSTVFTMASCNDDGDSKFIGIAMPETHVERWVGDGERLRADARERGFRAEAMWANADQNAQNQHIQSFITQGANLLIIGSVNEGVGSAVAEAARANIPVIAYDRIIANSGDYEYYITFNNFEVGRMQGQSIVTALGLDSLAATDTPRTITLFAGSPTDGNAFFFFDGAMDVLLPYIDRGVLRVIGPFPRTSRDSAFQAISTENWQAPLARTRMDNLLTGAARDEVLDAVLAPNDTLARAIIESLRADAKYQTALPVITGQDAEFDSMMSIRDGGQYSTVFKDTNKLAESAVLLAYQILNDLPREIPGVVLAEDIGLGNIGDTGVKTVQTFLLAPVLVTRENMNIPLDAGFFTEEQTAQLRQQ